MIIDGVGVQDASFRALIAQDAEQHCADECADDGGDCELFEDFGVGVFVDEGEFEEVVGEMDEGRRADSDFDGHENGEGGHQECAEAKAREKGQR